MAPSRAAVALDTPIQYVKGVGPLRAKLFGRLGVHTVGDLVQHFPFRYDLRPKSQAIGSLQLDQVATIVGEIRGLRSSGRFGGGTVNAQVVDGTGVCRVRWFNSPYLMDRLNNGTIVRLSGKVDQYGQLASLTNPQTTVIDRAAGDPLANESEAFEPVYPATEGLLSRDIAKALRQVLEAAVEQIEEILPEELRAVRKFPPRRTAILRYHRPIEPADADVARRRLAYDELLVFQLAVQLSRARKSAGPAALEVQVPEKTDARIRARLPFELTAGQNKAVQEITADLARPVPMNRLLQGDVGAGKTAVAVYAALAVIAAKGQVALLAPTEVLAEQHRAKVEQYLRGSRVRVGFLTGSTRSRERAAILRALATGQLNWLVGTHAILEPDVRFKCLALSVVDEQHKFGVSQRAALARKGPSPHTLVLTATPIPRSLAMTLYGDLDVSTIRELPPGRQPIVTRLVTPDKIEAAWSFVRKRLAAGEQAYIVYPLVEESRELPALKAASAEAEELAKGRLAGFKLAVLHGRMRPAEKSAIMAGFRKGDVRVLVATTVIEVGVDVPNATMMLIQHAERYGLSQLHQLRGRIGRGNRKSFCFLFAETKGPAELSIPGSHAPLSNPRSSPLASHSSPLVPQPSPLTPRPSALPTPHSPLPTTPPRLAILTQTSDGFRIAEEDLRLRGPGELLGTKQHGMPTFRVADIVSDLELMQLSREDAAAILRRDPRLSLPEHASLRGEVQRRHGRLLRLIKIG